jgi:hypothetical protein
MPWFLDPTVHSTLLRSLELQLLHFGGTDNAIKPDVIVGLDARGFLFGPSLALRLNASFVPVRKKGKLPGPCVTAEFTKEYGTDYFQMQEGAIKPGQKVLVVDDIIATGRNYSASHPWRAHPDFRLVRRPPLKSAISNTPVSNRWLRCGRRRPDQAAGGQLGRIPFYH